MKNTKLTKQLLHTTDNYIKALEKAGILTVEDLINHFPRDYDDRTHVLDSFSLINIKEKNTILVKLLTINTTKTGNNKILTKAVLEDKNGFLSEAVWFNRKFLASQLTAFTGKKILVSGKVKYAFGKVTFQSPETETDLSKIGGEIVSIYSDLNYIPSKWIVGKIGLLKGYIPHILTPSLAGGGTKPHPNPPLIGEGTGKRIILLPRPLGEDGGEGFFREGTGKSGLPDSIVKKYGFISRGEALYKIHFPKNQNDIELAKFRLAYEELFNINYKAIASKYEKFENTTGKSISIEMDANLVKKILKHIPFDLTDHQKIALFQILKDMEKPHSMQRLLEGDVGTGKTVIALISAIHGILKVKIQVALMAPTEILARQHFDSIQKLLFEFGLKSHLLVGSTTAKEKKQIKQDLKVGNIDIIVGTHALVQEDVLFHNLGYVIIDEQHRFGVKQREILETGLGNETGLIPHSLNMTATPIPRTLALTLYGDQDLSVISEYPKGRKQIITRVSKNDESRHQIELMVRSEVEKGRQVFWISPLVEESEKIDLANAINTYENLVEIFFPFKVGLVHGKMKPAEKKQVMQDFADNKIQILSATSVIEVGIDIPNATIMCIEGAERFGLSQLHQFRGRVGRGKYQSYCYLFPSKGQYTDRLRAMERTNNGFELSEVDLELRGPGEVYGLRQSGIPDLKIADLKDLELISQIREDIEELFE